MAEERTAWRPVRVGRVNSPGGMTNQVGILKLDWVREARAWAFPPTGWEGWMSSGWRIMGMDE